MVRLSELWSRDRARTQRGLGGLIVVGKAWATHFNKCYKAKRLCKPGLTSSANSAMNIFNNPRVQYCEPCRVWSASGVTDLSSGLLNLAKREGRTLLACCYLGKVTVITKCKTTPTAKSPISAGTTDHGRLMISPGSSVRRSHL